MREGTDIERLTAIEKYFPEIRRMRSYMSRRYKSICFDGDGGNVSEAENEKNILFADSFRVIRDNCSFLLGYEKKSRVSEKFSLAADLISRFGESVPTVEETVLYISEIAAKTSIPAEEIENLGFEIIFCLIRSIYSALKDRSIGSTNFDIRQPISLLMGMSSFDAKRINELTNPVSITLSKDEYYEISDRKTKKLYRTALYRLARKKGCDPHSFAEALVTDGGVCGGIHKILFAKKRALGSGVSAWFAEILQIFVAIALSISLAVGFSEPASAVFMIIPAYCAIKAAVSDILLRTAKKTVLPSLDPECERVKNTPCTIVMSAAIGGAEDADIYYDKLLKLRAANPDRNIGICLLADLPAAQRAVTGEDKPVAASFKEMITRLNKENDGGFSCVIRRRTYSNTQDEYMGKERKRGAICELAEYMTSDRQNFYFLFGEHEKLKGTEYIVCVDSDTEPYMDSVNELLAVALHPANTPSVENGRVIGGYGIISPRMVTRLGDSIATGFSRAVGGVGSVSSYDRESMELWQDVYGRGSFCGKGLINVKALLECTSDLPQERILSHDIPEGELLNAAYAGDIIFTEGFPKNPISYYKRLDRWIRGDVQNLRFILSKRFDALSKLKLWDNFRRAILPISVLAALYAGFFIYPEVSAKIAVSVVIMYLFPQLPGLIQMLIRSGMVPRRFYSSMVSGAALSISSMFYSFMFLPTTALKSARAILTALFRLATKSKLLEWTVSSSWDGAGQDQFAFFFPSWAVGAVLIFPESYTIRLFGAAFSFMPILLLGAFKSKGAHFRRITDKNRRELSMQLADMWGFFDDYVNESENFLPPDNVQFAPVYRICHRTSPTNIGMYLVSVLAACDRRLISAETMHKRISGTLDSIERMEKYKGNLYNWYETKTLKLCPNPYVSSVDSGNFICSLVALKEGLKEYEGRYGRISSEIKRIEAIVAECDLSIFYDDVRGLMSIGIFPESGELGRSRYDYLMSEARLGSFYAIASHQVPKNHWYSLLRTTLSCGFYAGTVSYSGTMFEYFMPELFIKSPEGSLLYESLRYALWCQKRYAKLLSRPFGISESGYYSFDSNLSYRYLAHGVPKTGLSRGLDSGNTEPDYVVSPYSTYISLGYSPNSGMDNLAALKKLGMYSRYGFYEAIDFTASETGKGYGIVKSCMAHHVGMSIIASANVLEDGIFQKRFMRDKSVIGASELLNERVRLERDIYEDAIIKPKLRETEQENVSAVEYITSVSPERPRVKLLRNGEYTLVLTDGGLSLAMYRGLDVYAAVRDTLLRPKGAFFGFKTDDGGAMFTSGVQGDGDLCEFGDGFAEYQRSAGEIKSRMRVSLHRSFPCEIRRFTFENISDDEKKISLVSYIEPSLIPYEEETSHPAYQKMFVRPERDPALDIITVTRSDTQGAEKPYMALGIGFTDSALGTVSFDREDVLKRPEGVAGLLNRADEISSSFISEPDPCVFIRTAVTVPPKSQISLEMFIAASDSYGELINMCSELKTRPKDHEKPEHLYSSASVRLCEQLISNALFCPQNSPKRRDAASVSNLPLTALWELSLSTDIPLILFKFDEMSDRERLGLYIRAFSELRLAGIKAQMAVLYDDGGSYGREYYSALIRAAKEQKAEGLLYSNCGIFPIDRSLLRDGMSELIKAYACHISTADFDIIGDTIGENMIEISGVKPQKLTPKEEIALGGFLDGAHSYVINEKPPLPWCHVLSSRQFGTLLSEGSLGFSYAFNSRELRLTPWDNDTSRDNIGERLILKIGGKYYDLIRGSAAIFSTQTCSAEYRFEEKLFKGSVTVGVSDKGMCKRIRVNISLKENAELSYYTEPCLGENRKNAHLLKPEWAGNTLLISNCASPIKGYMAITSSMDCRFQTDRAKFFTGDFGENVFVGERTIAAATVDVSGSAVVDFYLSFAMNRGAAELMPKLFVPQKDTRERQISTSVSGDESLLLNGGWLRYQALHARLWARTGFYQSSGAYGFRDQLQDAVGIIPENPHECYVQIVRAAGAQFYEGDVMHWRHVLPLKKTLGIRSKISDDPLWLVYAVCEYIEKTGDKSILDVKVRYCCGIELSEGERDRCGEVYHTSAKEPIYDHCMKALDFVYGKKGRHGLLLIGTGDWNDGFSKLGERGIGESVWLGEFYILVAKRFSEICRQRDIKYAEELLSRAKELESLTLEHGVGRDKDRYLRAYTDSGEVLGDESSESCKLDSLTQSFAQFAGLKNTEFTENALRLAYERLCDTEGGVVKLFTPPFRENDRGEIGYIASYPAGLRENGGQYTHAAVWLGMACMNAGLKDEGKAILRTINPVRRSRGEGYLRYKTEPYYIAGDVYSNKNCYSRGGWSIYTGSAAWYYRALIENGEELSEKSES